MNEENLTFPESRISLDDLRWWEMKKKIIVFKPVHHGFLKGVRNIADNSQ